MPDGNQSESGSQLKKLGLACVIIADWIGFTLAGVGIGYWAWTRWNAPIWVLFLTSLTGLGLAFYRLYKLIQKEI